MIEDRTRRLLDVRLARDQASQRLPSVAAGLVRDGEIVWTGGRGLVDGQAPDATTQYRAGSITKTFVAVLRAPAAGRRQLSLSDPLGEHLNAATAGAAVGHDHRPAALALGRAAGRDSRALVGAHSRSLAGRAVRLLARRRGGQVPARPPASLLQRRLCAARRTARGRARPALVRRNRGRAARPAGHGQDHDAPAAPVRAAATRCIRTPTCCWPSPSTTRARWHPPDSSGPRWPTWPHSPGSSPARPGCSRPRRWPRCASRS